MKIYKFIGFIALLGWSAVSCNDWLDVRPDTEQKEEDQFSTYKGFRDALTGCYMALANEDVYGCRLTMSCTELWPDCGICRMNPRLPAIGIRIIT